MLNRWLRVLPEDALRRVLGESVLWPGAYYNEGRRCLVGAAADSRSFDATDWMQASAESRKVVAVERLCGPCHDTSYRFDALCARFTAARITVLVQHSVIRELVRRGASVPVQHEAVAS